MKPQEDLKEKQWAALSSGASQFIRKEEFFRKLDEGRPLTVKAGFDPTRPDIHLGHLVLINKLRQFQDLGHKVVFVAGDWTARIGDPSGRNKTRPRVSKREAEQNAQTYISQACLPGHPFHPYPPDLQKGGQEGKGGSEAKEAREGKEGKTGAAASRSWNIQNHAGSQRSWRLHQGLRRLKRRQTRFVKNSQWLGRISLIDFIEEISRKSPSKPLSEAASKAQRGPGESFQAQRGLGFTLAHILSRKEFADRYKQKSPIGMHELFYPFAQAYDSLHLKADVEAGGQDQLFNLLFARDFQASRGEARQCVVVLPLIEGLDGARKMSKSLGNTIDFKDSVQDMFGKVMSVSDELMIRWWKALAGLGEDFERRLRSKALHAMEEKKRLAFGIASSFHGPAAACEAMAGFDGLFSKQRISLSIPERQVEAFLDKRLSELMMELDLAPSIGAARRLIVSGAVRYKKLSASDEGRLAHIDKNSLSLIKDPEERVSLCEKESALLKSGKRQALKIQSLAKEPLSKSVPGSDKLCLPILQALQDRGAGVLRLEDMKESVRKRLNLKEEALREKAEGRNQGRFEGRVWTAAARLRLAGLARKDGGGYAISEKGQALLSCNIKALEIRLNESERMICVQNFDSGPFKEWRG